MLFNQKSNLQTLRFTPPVLREGKETYVEFYAYSPVYDALRRKRIKLNRIQSKTERRKYGRQLCSEISTKLYLGWTPFLESASPRATVSLRSAIESFLSSKRKLNEKSSMIAYESMSKMLFSWMKAEGYSDEMPVSSFNHDMAVGLMKSIEENPKVSYLTYGNRLRFYNILFTWLQDGGYVTANPFGTIKWSKKKAESKKRRRMLSSDEKSALKNYLDENGYHPYLAMCLICYYCFMRDKEICLLRVGDIDLQHQVIRVSGSIAKNDHSSARTIPDVLLPYLKRLKLDCPDDYYLFSDCEHYAFEPGKKACTSRKVYNFWDRYVRTALGWGTELSFYSLKDTGITDLTSSGVPLNIVQGQADHSNVSITSAYLSCQTPAGHELLKKVNTF